jgi:hypothetical protein
MDAPEGAERPEECFNLNVVGHPTDGSIRRQYVFRRNSAQRFKKLRISM